MGLTVVWRLILLVRWYNDDTREEEDWNPNDYGL
jgi:hypothetical protein